MHAQSWQLAQRSQPPGPTFASQAQLVLHLQPVGHRVCFLVQRRRHVHAARQRVRGGRRTWVGSARRWRAGAGRRRPTSRTCQAAAMRPRSSDTPNALKAGLDRLKWIGLDSTHVQMCWALTGRSAAGAPRAVPAGKCPAAWRCCRCASRSPRNAGLGGVGRGKRVAGVVQAKGRREDVRCRASQHSAWQQAHLTPAPEPHLPARPPRRSGTCMCRPPSPAAVKSGGGSGLETRGIKELVGLGVSRKLLRVAWHNAARRQPRAPHECRQAGRHAGGRPCMRQSSHGAHLQQPPAEGQRTVWLPLCHRLAGVLHRTPAEPVKGKGEGQSRRWASDSVWEAAGCGTQRRLSPSSTLLLSDTPRLPRLPALALA